MKHKSNLHRRKSRREFPTRKVLFWLIACFPAGLFYLWSDRCSWHKVLKCITSLLLVAVLTVIVLPQTTPPGRANGGVVIVSMEDDLIGPQPDSSFQRIDLYSYNVTQDSVIAEPEPTPVPVYVYCNDGGKYYHSADCSFVKNTSHKVPLLQALNAGYKKCAQCNAPEEY